MSRLAGADERAICRSFSKAADNALVVCIYGERLVISSGNEKAINTSVNSIKADYGEDIIYDPRVRTIAAIGIHEAIKLDGYFVDLGWSEADCYRRTREHE